MPSPCTGLNPCGWCNLHGGGHRPTRAGEGDEETAYVVLDTYNEDVPRDRLRDASPMVTECPQ